MAKKNEIKDICLGFKINDVFYPTEEIPEFVVERTMKAMKKMLDRKEIFIETNQAG